MTLTERINRGLQSSLKWIPARISLAILSWLGFINLYMTRINLSVIIVAMVGSKNSSSGVLAPCLMSGNTTEGITEGATEGNITQEQDELNLHVSNDVMEWSEVVQGFVLGSFYYGYCVTQIPGGRLAEMYGTKWVFGGCILGGGICAVLSPCAARCHYGLFICLRIIQGLIQGVSWPSMHACITQWIPPLERPRFIGAVYFANNLSTAITLPICGLIIDRYGWPAAFYFTGTFSILWFILWFFFMYDYPSQHPRISAGELEYIQSAVKNSGTSVTPKHRSSQAPWRYIFTSMPVWAIVSGDIGSGWGIGLFFTQLPTYMKNILGFNIKENGYISALPFAFRYLGAITQGTISDFLLTQRYCSIKTARRIFGTFTLWGPAIMLVGVAYAGCDWVATIVMFCMALFFNGGLTASMTVNHTDIAPNYAGTTFGVSNTAANFVGFFAPVIAGFLTNGQQTVGQWQKVFWVCVPAYIIGHFFFFIFCSGDVQSWNYYPQEDNKRAVTYMEVPQKEEGNTINNSTEGKDSTEDM